MQQGKGVEDRPRSDEATRGDAQVNQKQAIVVARQSFTRIAARVVSLGQRTRTSFAPTSPSQSRQSRWLSSSTDPNLVRVPSTAALGHALSHHYLKATIRLSATVHLKASALSRLLSRSLSRPLSCHKTPSALFGLGVR